MFNYIVLYYMFIYCNVKIQLISSTKILFKIKTQLKIEQSFILL